MHSYRYLTAAAVICLVAFSLPANAHAQDDASDADAPSTISYHSDIRPIFVEHCQGCHQPAKPSGEYVMTRFDSLLAGGESEMPAVVPGDLTASRLLELITPDEDGEAEMPQGKPALHDEQIEKIRAWIAAGAEDDSPAAEQTLVDAEHPPVYEQPPVITSVAFSPDGSLLAIAAYHEVILYQADGSAPVARLVGLSERIESIAFSPDGSHLAVTGGSPGRFGEVQIWDVAERELLLAKSVTFDTIYGASFSGDGKLVAFGCGDNTLRAIAADSGEQVLFQGAHNDWVLDTVFSTDDSHLMSVSRDRSVKLTEVATERFVDNITSITPGALKGGLLSVDRHPTEDHIAIGGADGVPKIYQIYRTKDRKIGDDFNLIRKFDAMPGRVFSVDFSHDGKLVAAGSSYQRTGEVRVYQYEDGKLVSRVDDQLGGIYAVAFHPDGATVASAGFEGTVRLSESATGKVTASFVPVPVQSTEVAAAQNSE